MVKTKKSQIGAIIIIFLVIILSIFQYQQAVQQNEQIKSLEENCPRTIKDIKGPLKDKYLGKTVTVEGYIVIIDNKYPILIQTLDLLIINMKMPEELYLPLHQLDIKQAQELERAFVYAKGQLIEIEKELKLDLEKGKIHPKSIDIQKMKQHADILEKFELNPHPLFQTGYAVLISGGGDLASAHSRYWYDLKYMYAILVNNYSYNPQRITVIYKNGVGNDIDIPVDYGATIVNVTNVFTDIANNITKREALFVFTSNHGGGFHPTDPYRNYNYGLIDDDGDELDAGYSEQLYGMDFNDDGDTTDNVIIDETLTLYYDQQIRDDDLADLLDQIICRKMIIVMGQCFSGGFIHELSGENRTILTACHEEEFSYAADREGDFDEFLFHFMDAVDISTQNADDNNDGIISMVEAFNFASQNDNRPEDPHYDDNGDQTGHEEPIPNGGDGTIGANYYL